MPTNFHDYETPPKFTPNWHVPLNENFAALDHDIPVVDIEANRPSTPPLDTQFVSTDARRIDVFAGETTGWKTVAGRGAAQHPLAAGPYTSGLFQRSTLPSGESLTVPTGYGWLMADHYHVEGDLTVDGTFKIV